VWSCREFPNHFVLGINFSSLYVSSKQKKPAYASFSSPLRGASWSCREFYKALFSVFYGFYTHIYTLLSPQFFAVFSTGITWATDAINKTMLLNRS
jgi:hypothetical protein